eukprot:scaffold405_cov241-Chaetoceros_neogracile.AAC.3
MESIHVPARQSTSNLPNSFPSNGADKKTDAQITNKRRMVPMTKEEYEMQQSTVREVYDPESGRYRLVKGTGEIIERIVSRSDHERINKIATKGDGMSFTRHIRDAAQRQSK